MIVALLMVGALNGVPRCHVLPGLRDAMAHQPEEPDPDNAGGGI
jgi:hypothetical protein